MVVGDPYQEFQKVDDCEIEYGWTLPSIIKFCLNKNPLLSMFQHIQNTNFNCNLNIDISFAFHNSNQNLLNIDFLLLHTKS